MLHARYPLVVSRVAGRGLSAVLRADAGAERFSCRKKVYQRRTLVMKATLHPFFDVFLPIFFVPAEKPDATHGYEHGCGEMLHNVRRSWPWERQRS